MQYHRAFHSPFQIDNFIVGRAGTPWAQFQQCLREIATREAAIDADKIALHALCAEIDAHASVGDDERASIKIRQKDRLVNMICERVLELSRFREIAKTIRETLGDLTPERIEQLDLEDWEFRLRMSAGTDLITFGQLSRETVSLMLACPIEMRKRLIASMEEPDELKQFALTGGDLKLLTESAG